MLWYCTSNWVLSLPVAENDCPKMEEVPGSMSVELYSHFLPLNPELHAHPGRDDERE